MVNLGSSLGACACKQNGKTSPLDCLYVLWSLTWNTYTCHATCGKMAMRDLRRLLPTCMLPTTQGLHVCLMHVIGWLLAGTLKVQWHATLLESPHRASATAKRQHLSSTYNLASSALYPMQQAPCTVYALAVHVKASATPVPEEKCVRQV